MRRARRVTGGAVRLSNSGLGCPTWPRCTDDSYVSTPEMGIHGAIEFGLREREALEEFLVAHAGIRGPGGVLPRGSSGACAG